MSTQNSDGSPWTRDLQLFWSVGFVTVQKKWHMVITRVTVDDK